MKNITFKRIDNGYRCKPSYLCSNGLTIEPGDEWMDAYKYYVGKMGFDYLKDAKAHCVSKGVAVHK